MLLSYKTSFVQISVVSVLLFFCHVPVLLSQTANDWVGYSYSVRNQGVAGALGAAPDEFDEVTLDPAAIGLLGGTDLSFTQSFWSATVSGEHFTYSQRLPGGDGFSLGGDYINFGSYASSNGGTYAPEVWNLYAGYGLRLSDTFRVGLTGHFIFDDINLAAGDMTGAVDAGLLYHPSRSPLSVSAVVTDLGFNLDNAALPSFFRAAWAYQVNFDGLTPGDSLKDRSCLNLLGQGNWSLVTSTNTSFDLGAEGWYQGIIALRAGYQFAHFVQTNEPFGFSVGAGLRLDDLQVDYALTTLGDFSTTNQVSLSLALGEPNPNAIPTAQPVTPLPTPKKTVTPEPTVMPASAATLPPTSTPTIEAGTPTVTVVIPKIAFADEGAEAEANLPPKTAKMWHHFHKAYVALQAGDYRTAMSGLKESLKQPGASNWRYAESYAMMGIIEEYRDTDEGHLDRAKTYYLKSLKLDPRNEISGKHIQRWKKKTVTTE